MSDVELAPLVKEEHVEDVKMEDVAPSGHVGQSAAEAVAPQIKKEQEAWVQCDACSKWRRIPASVADSLSEDIPWHCKDNPNAAIASCSTPQELSNEEIDARAIVNDQNNQATEENNKTRHKLPAVIGLIRDNVFSHRKRKFQDEDDVMICQCKPVWRGGDGCGPDCINRLLCIECVPGFCPCEDKCTNQVFSKKQFAQLEVKRAGQKGFGLFALEPIKAGQFIIEYVGEVLEEDEYLRRKEFYADTGTRHYYFMNVGNGEVIDAYRMGNVGRFMNHSCEPNCETQKWLVHGELAIGFFSIKDIEVGEELTFDYNFERYDDKPMKCYCRSKGCRRTVGGGAAATEQLLSLLGEIEDEDASGDLPPLMVTDKEVDRSVQAILDWRVGVEISKDKRKDVIARLNKLCKIKGVEVSAEMLGGGSLEQALATGITADEDEDEESEEDEEDEEGGGEDVEEEDEEGEDKKKKAAPKGVKPKSGSKAAGGGGGKKKKEESFKALEYIQKQWRAQASDDPSKEAAREAAVKPAPARRKKPAQPAVKPAPAASKAKAPVESSSAQPVKPPRASMDTSAATPNPVHAQEVPRELSKAQLQQAKAAAALLSAAKKRSEVDRRLDALVAASGRLKDPSRVNIVKVLRMFNLCDMSGRQAGGGGVGAGAKGPLATQGPDRPPSVPPATPHPHPHSLLQPQSIGSANGAEGAVAPGGDLASSLLSPPGPGSLPPSGPCSIKPNPSTLEGPGAAGASSGALVQSITGKQRARMADMSLLLDVVLKTSAQSVKKEFVACGVLNQLHQAIGRNFGRDFSVVLRKILRVVESLPLTANDVFSVRSSHGTFASVLQELSLNVDFDVRSTSASILKKYPLGSCTDPSIIQQYQAATAGKGGGGGQGQGTGSRVSGSNPSPHPTLLGVGGKGLPNLMRPGYSRPPLPPITDDIPNSHLLAAGDPGGGGEGGPMALDEPSSSNPGAGGGGGKRRREEEGPLVTYSSRGGGGAGGRGGGRWGGGFEGDRDWDKDRRDFPGGRGGGGGLGRGRPSSDPYYDLNPSTRTWTLPHGDPTSVESAFALGIMGKWRQCDIGGREGEGGLGPLAPLSPITRPEDIPEASRDSRQGSLQGQGQETLSSGGIGQQQQQQQQGGGGGSVAPPSEPSATAIQAEPPQSSSVVKVTDLRAAAAARTSSVPSQLMNLGASSGGGGNPQANVVAHVDVMGGLKSPPTLLSDSVNESIKSHQSIDLSSHEPIWEGWSQSPSSFHPEIWEAPNDSFESFVQETVQHRLGRFVIPQPPNSPYHSSKMGHEEASLLLRKIVREVVEKERHAYEERLQQSVYRPIEKRKLESNVKEFVKQSVRRFHASRQQEAAASAAAAAAGGGGL